MFVHTASVAAPPRPPIRTRGASVADLRAAISPLVQAGNLHELTEFLLAAYGLMYDKKQELERWWPS